MNIEKREWREVDQEKFGDDFLYDARADEFHVKWEAPCGTWYEKSAPRSFLEQKYGHYMIYDEAFCWRGGKLILGEKTIPARLTVPPEGIVSD